MIKKLIRKIFERAGYDLVRRRSGPEPAKPIFPILSHYSLRYGPDDRQSCEFDFWLANNDANQWYNEWFHEAKNPTWELDEFSWLVQPGDKILEIGCHHGFLTMMLAQHIGPEGRILAIDALPENVMIAQSQIALNKLQGRCEALNYAGADRPGQARIVVRTNSHVIVNGAESQAITVEAVTGDWLDQRYGPFNVLKLDVEGFEVQVLKGCKSLLSRKPKLILELHPNEMNEWGYGASLEDVFQLIGADGYEGTKVVRPNFEISLPFAVSTVPRDNVSNVHLRPKSGPPLPSGERG